MRNETAQIPTAELSAADLDNVAGGAGVTANGALSADMNGASGNAGLELTGLDAVTGTLSSATSTLG